MAKFNIFGIPFDCLTLDELSGILLDAIDEGRRLRLAFSNPEFLVEAKKNEFLKNYLKGVDYNLADGYGVFLASRLSNNPLPERVTGTDFTYRMAELSHEFGFKIFLLGGRPGVAERAKDRLEGLYPDCRIVGCSHGFLSDDENKELLGRINELSPHFLMVCLGNPKQEKWISSNFENLNVNVVFGNGGALDFAAGVVRRAPIFMRNTGFEWLWRLFQDFNVARVKRLLKLPIFVYYFALEKVGDIFARR